MSTWTAPEFKNSALVTIDVQLDTLDGKAFEIPGTSAALPCMEKLCSAFRAHGKPLVHVLRLYMPDGTNAELCRREALQSGEAFFLAGSRGRMITPQLLPEDAVEPDDQLLMSGQLQSIGPQEWYSYKPRWGAFYQTGLQAHLEQLGVSTIVLAGCNYPNCVRATVYEASARDFRVVTITDGISNFTEHGWQELRSIGINVMDSESVLAAISAL